MCESVQYNSIPTKKSIQIGRFGKFRLCLAENYFLRIWPQPVGDLPLYSKKGGDICQDLGRLLYKQFDDATYHLYQQMRQQGAENEEFKDRLERLATGKLTTEDWKIWEQRDISNLTEDQRNSFVDEATMLCAKKKDMAWFNAYHLKKTGHPIAILNAINSKGASVFNADHAQGLANKIYLSKGAKVVLTQNLWTSAKLVNGSQGTVEFLIYKGGKNPRTHLPDVIICKFPEYCGPSFLPHKEKLVPIKPKSVNWSKKNEKYSRSQYPLINSWALTIHKSQGVFKGIVRLMTILMLNDRVFLTGHIDNIFVFIIFIFGS